MVQTATPPWHIPQVWCHQCINTARHSRIPGTQGHAHSESADRVLALQCSGRQAQLQPGLEMQCETGTCSAAALAGLSLGDRHNLHKYSHSFLLPTSATLENIAFKNTAAGRVQPITCRESAPVRELYERAFTNPGSTTYRTPGTVMDVSAMFVARMTCSTPQMISPWSSSLQKADALASSCKIPAIAIPPRAVSGHATTTLTALIRTNLPRAWRRILEDSGLLLWRECCKDRDDDQLLGSLYALHLRSPAH